MNLETFSYQSYVSISGRLTIIGREPDGDSVRFIPDHPETLQKLAMADRLKISTVDGSVQLRLDSIDTPETHYQGKSQPRGLVARDTFLRLLGFTNLTYADNQSKVIDATPHELPATIIAKIVEAHGRPVAYLFPQSPDLLDAQPAALTTELLTRSYNAQMVANGEAYITLYTSTPEVQRRFFLDLAARARAAHLGVWKEDVSHNFNLQDQPSIGPEGQLILPKLFRRCSDYLRDQQKGFTGTITEWLKRATDNYMSENDELYVGSDKKHLSDVLLQNGSSISFTADLLDVVFAEK